jgi:hypothetical protein
MVIVGDAREIDSERALSEHGHQQQILQIIADAPMQAAVEVKLNSLVVGHHSRVESHLCSTFGHDYFGAVGDRFY